VYLKTKGDTSEIGTDKLFKNAAFWSFLERCVNQELSGLGVGKRLSDVESEYVFDALFPLLDCILENFFDAAEYPESMAVVKRFAPALCDFVARIIPSLDNPSHIKGTTACILRLDGTVPQVVSPKVFQALDSKLHASSAGIIPNSALQLSVV
jgi:hypothetical protein